MNKKGNNKKFKYWNIIWPMLLYLGLIIVSGFIIGIIAWIIEIKTGYLITKIPGVSYSIGNIAINIDTLALIGLAITQTICLIVCYKSYKKNIQPQIKKSKTKTKTNKIIYGICFVLCIAMITDLSFTLIEKIGLIKMDFATNNVMYLISLKSNLILTILTTAILAPLMEETIFRGIILNRLLMKYSEKKSIIISALLFGIIHMALVQGIEAFIIGLGLGMIFVKTKSLKPCIIAHAINNSLAIILSQTIGNSLTTTYLLVELIILGITIIPSLNFIKDNKIA